MDKVLEKLDWKILIGILLFFIVTLILIFLFYNTKQSNLDTYQDAGFSLSHPKDITASPVTVSGGGQGVVFNPPAGSDYSLELQIMPSTKTNNAEIINQLFRILEYSEKDINIDNISGKEFTGSNVIVDKTIQEKAAILENNGQIYKLHLGYYANQRNIETDNLFTQVLSTLKFN